MTTGCAAHARTLAVPERAITRRHRGGRATSEPLPLAVRWSRRAPPSSRAVGAGRGLLELDPDLGQLLSDERRAAAERELRVRVTTFPIGEWDGARLADADPAHLGLLIAEGVLAREVVLGDTVSTELLGPGDIIRPWHIEGPPQLLAVTIRWNALSADPPRR